MTRERWKEDGEVASFGSMDNGVRPYITRLIFPKNGINESSSKVQRRKDGIPYRFSSRLFELMKHFRSGDLDHYGRRKFVILTLNS